MRALAAAAVAAVAIALAACSSSPSTPSPSPAPTGTATSSDTWSGYAENFTATYCVECHDAKDPTGRDFTIYAKLASARLEVRCGVAATQDPSWGCASFPPAEQFPTTDGKTPPNPKPSDAERARFVAWLSAGAPE